MLSELVAAVLRRLYRAFFEGMLRWTGAEQPAEPTAWHRAERQTSAWANNHPIWFGLVSAPWAGIVAGLAAWLAAELPVGLQILLWGVGAFLGFLLAVALLTIFFWARMKWASRPKAQVPLLREQLAEARRSGRTHEIRAELLLSIRTAEETIPPLIAQIQPTVTTSTYSGARNRAAQAMSKWVKGVGPLLREGGQPQLAETFETAQGEDRRTREGLEAAYRIRTALLTPLPHLEKSRAGS